VIIIANQVDTLSLESSLNRLYQALIQGRFKVVSTNFDNVQIVSPPIFSQGSEDNAVVNGNAQGINHTAHSTVSHAP
jgi:hypothetical protein